MSDRPADEDDATILRRYGIEPDPVIEAYKRRVNRKLLRAYLRLTPEERLERHAKLEALIKDLRDAGLEGHSRADLEALLDARERRAAT